MLQLEHYKKVVIELEGMIELHNKSIGGSESGLKQNIEFLTRSTLAKKSIEVKGNVENLLKGAADLEALKTKVQRIEMNKFTGSQALGSIAGELQMIVSSSETTSIKTSKIITSESFKESIVVEK